MHWIVNGTNAISAGASKTMTIGSAAPSQCDIHPKKQ